MKIEAKEEAEKIRNIDYTGIEVDGSLDDSVEGFDENDNEDIKPIAEESNDDNFVNRGNVFFIPLLSNHIPRPFRTRAAVSELYHSASRTTTVPCTCWHL